MTLKKKLIIGFTIAAVGAASAAFSGIMPLLDASRQMRDSSDAKMQLAAESLTQALGRASLAAALSASVSVLAGVLIAFTVVPRIQRFGEDAEALAGGMLKDPLPTNN